VPTGLEPEAQKADETPRSANGLGFEFKARNINLADLGKFLLLILGPLLGLYNVVDKAPAPQLERVEVKQDATRERIEGRRDRDSGELKTPGLADRLVDAEKRLARLEALRCPEQHFIAAALGRAGVHGVVVQNCAAPAEIEAVPDIGMPGRQKPRTEWTIRTPMPAP
jgi:hypothetical protein